MISVDGGFLHKSSGRNYMNRKKVVFLRCICSIQHRCDGEQNLNDFVCILDCFPARSSALFFFMAFPCDDAKGCSNQARSRCLCCMKPICREHTVCHQRIAPNTQGQGALCIPCSAEAASKNKNIVHSFDPSIKYSPNPLPADAPWYRNH